MHHIKEQLEGYLAGELTVSENSQFDGHVARCSSCRNELNAALEARQCMEWLAPTEAPPQPGPEFYWRVQRSIEKKMRGGWLANLSATMRLQFAYPLGLLCLLMVAWSLTASWKQADPITVENGFAATEYPATEFAQMSFRTADQGREAVIMNLVGTPEQQ